MKQTIALAFTILTMVACTTEGLAFVQDRRVEVVEPEYREVVDSPVRIDWSVVDEELTNDLGVGTQFGVYVDIDPQPPGESLDYFGRDDAECQKIATCPDSRYLRQRGIHTTADTEMTFPSLPIAPDVDIERGQSDVHFVTLTLLDMNGVRLGESAWQITFEIDREGG